MNHSPPKWTIKFLRWFCRPVFLEEVEGDLTEIFRSRVRERGSDHARRTFIFDVLKFLRWTMLRKPDFAVYSLNRGLWLYNMKIAFRVFRRNLLHSTINLFGLTMGILSFIVLTIYYLNENSFDRFPDSDQIYRIATSLEDDGYYTESAQSPVPILPMLVQDLPQIRSSVRLLPLTGYLKKAGPLRFREEQLVFTDETFFEVFQISVLKGNMEEALTQPFTMVLTEEKAAQYFGDGNAIGEMLIFEDEDNQFEFTVTAVVSNFSHHSHLNVDFLVSFQSLNQVMPWHNNWFYPTLHSYVRLVPDHDAGEVEIAANRVLQNYAEEKYLEKSPELVFQPVHTLHLSSDRQGEWEPNSTQINVQYFFVLGLIILGIAMINYINLSTANSIQRSKEIGMKKAMGSSRPQLIRQFFSESFLMVSGSAIISLVLLLLFWSPFSTQLFGRQISLYEFLTLRFLTYGLSVIFLLTLAAGFYPTLLVSRFRTLDVLRNRLSGYQGKGIQRKILVTIQFSISMVLILATLLLVEQYQYLLRKGLGFQKEYRVAIKLVEEEDKKNYKALKDALKQLSFVDNVAVSNTILGSETGFYGFEISLPDKPELGTFEWYTLGVDEDYLDTYGLELTAGRDFSRSLATDQHEAVIINETAARYLGWKGDAVGKGLNLTIYTGKRETRNAKIIGVVRDFHYQSLYESVKPLVIYINKHHYYTDNLNLKLQPGGSVRDRINRIEKIYGQFNPDKPIELVFMEERIAHTYHRELLNTRILSIFTILSIFIAGLGVFGLITFSTHKRIKEIGIRKVLGASFLQISGIFTKEYLYLIVVACVISWPVVHWFSTKWLQNFAYSVDFGILNYLAGFSVVLIIGLISSLHRIIWVAKMNPVDHLRNE